MAAQSRIVASLAVALIATTLAIKFTTVRNIDFQPPTVAQVRELGARASAQGFEMVSVGKHVPYVVLQRGPCTAKLRLITSEGTEIAASRVQDMGVGPIRYRYRGEWYERPPRIRMALDEYLVRYLPPLGIAYERPIILSEARSDTCDKDAISSLQRAY